MLVKVDNNRIFSKDVRQKFLKNKLSDDDKILLFKWMIQGYDSDSEWDDFRPHIKALFNEYKENIIKIKKLESKFEYLDTANTVLKGNLEKLDRKFKQASGENKIQKKEIEKLKKENLRLKIISGETKSNWRKELDWIERDHPITGEPDGYECPIIFKHSKVLNLKKYIHWKHKEKWCEFCHPYPKLDSSYERFEMPDTAYRWLKGELPEQKKKSKLNIHNIKDDVDAKNYIKSIGGSTKGKYITRVLRFLIKRRGDTFDIEEFDEDCGFKGQRESRRQYIKKLIKWGFIEETKTQGIYRIIF